MAALWNVLYAVMTVFLACLNMKSVQGVTNLVFSNHSAILGINLESSKVSPRVLISGMQDIASMDYLYSDQLIFYSDVTQEVINMAYLNDLENRTTVARTDLISPGGIACDWIGRKLYWTDAYRKRIVVSSLDGSIMKVLIWENVDRLRAIAVSPEHGYMYWTDWGEYPAIERASMDGSRRTEIVTTHIEWPNGLTVDYKNSRLYWTDGKLKYIQRCNLDGSDRQPVIDRLKSPFGLTVYDDTVYWTDTLANSIHKCNKMTGREKETLVANVHKPIDVQVISASRQKTAPNPCGRNNGGCSHLCLLSSTKPFYTCACPTGVILKTDNKTCLDGPQKFLLVARTKKLSIVSLDMTDFIDVELPMTLIVNGLSIDYDPVDDYVYWTDDRYRMIWRAHMNGTRRDVFMRVETPNVLVVDWLNRKLYWTDSGLDRIEVVGLDGTDRQTIISEEIVEPTDICVDPGEGYIYWTDSGPNATIERAKVDGTDRTVLINSSLGRPSGLALDLRTRHMYWGDAEEGRIEKATMEGQNRTVVVASGGPSVFSVTVLDDYVYWTDKKRKSIERANKTSGTGRTTIIRFLPYLLRIKAVNLYNVSFEDPNRGDDTAEEIIRHLSIVWIVLIIVTIVVIVLGVLAAVYYCTRNRQQKYQATPVHESTLRETGSVTTSAA